MSFPKTLVIILISSFIAAFIATDAVTTDLRNRSKRTESFLKTPVSDEVQSAVSNYFRNVTKALVLQYQSIDSRLLTLENNDELDRAIRESLIFKIEDGYATGVQFDEGTFIKNRFVHIPGWSGTRYLRYQDISPKPSFEVSPRDSKQQ